MVLVREADRGGRPVLRLGQGHLDRYLEFVAARARPNKVLAGVPRRLPTITHISLPSCAGRWFTATRSRILR